MFDDVPAGFRVSSYQVLQKLDVVLRRWHLAIRHVPNSSGFFNDMEALMRPWVLLLALPGLRNSSGAPTGRIGFGHVFLSVGNGRERLASRSNIACFGALLILGPMLGSSGFVRLTVRAHRVDLSFAI